MGMARVKERRALAEAQLSLAYAVAEAGMSELAASVDTFKAVADRLGRLADGEHQAIRKSVEQMPAERKGAYLRHGVWHLPVAGSDKAPMLQEALLNLFPVAAPAKGWVLREIASAKEGNRRVSLKVTGQGLSQSELDVMLGAIIAAEGALDTTVEVNRTAFLKSIGRANSKASVDKLFGQFNILASHIFQYEEEVDGKLVSKSKGWNLIQAPSLEAYTGWGAIHKPAAIQFSIGEQFGRFFKLGFGEWSKVDMAIRRKLGGTQRLALWLHAYLSAYPVNHIRSLAEIHRISGSRVSRLGNFRIDLFEAAAELKVVGFLDDVRVSPKDGLLHFSR